MPDRLSVPVSVTWTGPAYQPLGSGSGTLAEVLGAVRSILMPLTVAFVVLPALSLTEALVERLSPSVVTVLLSLAGAVPSAVQLLMPDSASEQVKVTVTSALFQPLAFAAG